MSTNTALATSRKNLIISISVILATAVILLLSVNNWSLWLDEAITVEMYSVGSFTELIGQFSAYNGSEVQMPGWITFMWAWIKLFGNSEYALRSSNFLFIAILLIYAYNTLRHGELTTKELRIMWISLALTALSPFVLYNMNEARCNIPMFAIAFICTLSAWRFTKTHNQSDLLTCIVWFTIGYVFNMLFGFMAISLLTIVWSKTSGASARKTLKTNKITIALCLLAFIAASIYYLATIFVENKGGQIERPGIGNIGHVFYEFMGFNGLGPNKNALRESSDKIAMLANFAPQIAVFAICYIAIFYYSLKAFLQTKKINRFFLAFAIGFAAFFAAAFIIKFRFWSRHLFFLYPLWILFMGYCIDYFAEKSSKPIKWIVMAAFTCTLIISSYNIAFNNYYKKENVKGLVSKCKEIRNSREKIFWSESPQLPKYYNLKDSLIYFTAPTANDEGLFVWFNRLKPIKKTELQEFLDTHAYQLVFENRDFIIYRFSPSTASGD